MISQDRDCALAAHLEVHGSVRVYVIQSGEHRISVFGESQAAIDEIVIKTSNGVLSISNEGISLKQSKGLLDAIRSLFSWLGGAQRRESGDIQTGGHGNVPAFVKIYQPFIEKAGVYGSGEVFLEGFSVQQRLVLEVYGSGRIHAAGDANKLTAEVHGSGRIDSFGVRTPDARLTVNGSGRIGAYATFQAKAMVQGSGRIEVTGNPKAFSDKVEGSGSIKRLPLTGLDKLVAAKRKL